MGRLTDALVAGSGWAMGALLLGLVSLDVAQVVLRYGMGAGWPWAGDATIVGLLTLAWLGAGHLWLRGAHVAVSLLPGRAARAAFVVVTGLLLAACGVALPMVWEAVRLYSAIDLPALPLPMAAKYVPVLGGLVWLMACAAIRLAQPARW